MKFSQHINEEKSLWLLCLTFLSITCFSQKDTAIFNPSTGVYQIETEAEQLKLAEYQALQKKDCRTMHYEIMDIYPPTDDIPWGGDDLCFMDNHLKDLGFQMINGGWGNWMEGPRIVHLELEHGLCACSVDKKYWPHRERDGEILDWQITEEISCKQK